jgi:predicted RNA-binding Zn-ribbon protein involved in translation (DUF1610 family)
MVDGKKRLFYDIETSPNITFTWRTGYRLTIPHENILQERAIICICWKWEGDDQVHSLTWDKHQCDKRMIQKFVDILNTCDEAVAHNGNMFDLKWIKTRSLYHRIPMYPNYTTIDTLKIARGHFYLNSNKLDYIAKFLGFGGKMETGGFDLWKSVVLDKCKDSLEKMVEYCKRDVVLLEKVYNEIRTYSNHSFNYAVANGGDKHHCPNCGSPTVRLSKTRTTPAGTIRRQMKCGSCATYYTISNKSYQNHLQEKMKNNGQV